MKTKKKKKKLKTVEETFVYLVEELQKTELKIRELVTLLCTNAHAIAIDYVYEEKERLKVKYNTLVEVIGFMSGQSEKK